MLIIVIKMVLNITFIHCVSKNVTLFIFFEQLCQTSTNFNKIWLATS